MTAPELFSREEVQPGARCAIAPSRGEEGEPRSPVGPDIHVNCDVQYDACPVCDGQIRSWARKTHQQRTFSLDRCIGGCGYVFVNPRPDSQELQRFYEQLPASSETVEDVVGRERAYPNSVVDSRRIISALHHMGARSVLDVGCGFGFFSAEARARAMDVVALELGPAQRRCAQAIASVTPLDLPFEAYAASRPRRFDAILMSQILEHVSDVNVWMSGAYELLNDDGTLCVALPNFGSLVRRLTGTRDPYIIPPEHLNFFSPRSLGRLVSRHGFEVERVEHVSRLPRDIVGKRFRAGSSLRSLTEAATGVLTGTFAAVVDRVGMGIMINLYCRKRRSN